MAKQFTLGKQERLKSRKALDLLFREGKSLMVPPFRILYRPVPEGLQMAVGVSARHFKRAVDRNRIKRQVREAYRLCKRPLQDQLQAHTGGLHVFFTYTAREQTDAATILGAVQKGIDKLQRILHENNPATT